MTLARSPGGFRALARSGGRSSALRAAAWCRLPSFRANSASGLSRRSRVASYHDYTSQGDLAVLKEITPALLENEGEGVLILDDLTDTGKTAAVVREMMPKAHFATIYAKPKGRPLVDTFVTEVSQDTWIYFPWDMGFTYQKPIADDHAG